MLMWSQLNGGAANTRKVLFDDAKGSAAAESVTRNC
jgi:hypothetical protein